MLKLKNMISYEQSIKDFDQMDYEQKKKKVTSMLDVLREEGNVFEDVYNLIQGIGDVSEQLLDTTYKIIAKAMYNIKEEQLEQSLNEMEGVKGKLQNLREKEEKEKIEEDKHADSLLDQI